MKKTNMVRVCLGLDSTQQRPFTAEEEFILKSEARLFWRRGWLFFAAPLWILLLWIPLLSMFPHDLIPHDCSGIPWCPIWCVPLLTWPVAVVMSILQFRQSRRVHRALMLGYVEHFEGVPESYAFLGKAQQKLVSLGFLKTAPNVPQWIEIFPESHLLYKSNNQRVDPKFKLDVMEVAKHPDNTFRVSISGFREVEARDGVQRRHMAEDERMELHHHIRLTRPLLWRYCLLFVWTFLAGLGQVASLYHEYSSIAWRLPLIGILLTFCLYLGWRFHDKYSELREMELDREEGWVLCIPLRGKKKNNQPSEESIIEFLPHSITLWSLKGRRANWRHFKIS